LKFHIKFRRVRTPDNTGITMDMYYPFALKENKVLYFYSVVQFGGEWMLRIESAESLMEGRSVRQGAMRFYAIDYSTFKSGRVVGCLSNPFFSKIMRYDEFSSDHLTTWL